VNPKGLCFSAPISLAGLAHRHGGTVDDGAAALVVRQVAALEDGAEEDLCPLTSRRHLALALASKSVLLVDAELASLVPRGRRWVHPHGSWALAGVLEDLEPTPPRSSRDRPMIDPGAEIAEGVVIGPGVVIMAGVRIGEHSVIEPNAVLYSRVRLGARVVVGAGAIIGRPGFGWASGPRGEIRRIPQLGGVWVEDDVEIGPLATVDSGTLAPTVLRRGVKLDAHVHVGHNVEVGASSLVAAQSGFAGSVKLGAGVRVGGQAGIADHVRIGEGAQIAAKGGVIGDVPPGDVVAGYPAVGRARWLRGVARMLSLGSKRIK
jgi:UDP-3-O-[3-hydroxymyristoyl] glucosamine N-acyltransferase